MVPIPERVRRFYGAHPLHAVAILGSLALTGYVALRIVDDPTLPVMLLWFGGCVIAHDLVLFPGYALADRVAARAVRGGGPASPRSVRALNHLRVPALASGLLLLLFFPGIIEQGQDTYLAATGQDQQPFLARWLLLTAGFFATSALLYLASAVRSARRPPSPDGSGPD
ncbi:hypothetical protein CFN78_21140 [Amycolatopsis antarctica]|uniref:Uncharacterized protein n=1 Tax=Amycolatopsis antarctica TaxID=1854586 RepID=A0A263CYQ0_9PSEU|nr:hypothetical protein [Amycolatopsis antarctica]OZM71300.1 hypothetical protein CFN78_21140 [Amycolatopsis antarctica]